MLVYLAFTKFMMPFKFLALYQVSLEILDLDIRKVNFAVLESVNSLQL